jgi:cytochrome P450
MLSERRPGHPFDPHPRLVQLRERSPLSRLTYPDGHEGWVVTSHALVRKVLADARFSARNELRHVPFLTGGEIADKPAPAPPGAFIATDPPEHTRYRRLLTGQFTVRRLRQLTEHIQQLATAYLDAIEQQGPPADLVETLAKPIPAQVICELLGVPFADRDQFQDLMNVWFRSDLTTQERVATYTTLVEYMLALVTAKRTRPTDDLLSGLTASDLTDEELVNIGGSLLGAGLETTASMIGLGTFALLRHPDQLTALRADPTLADQAIEELLRYLSIVPGAVRSALEDVELNGQVIKAGETVTLSIPAANRDPEYFADPDTLDLRRSTAGHVAFGHGIHQCLGQQLARVELRVVLPALLARFPGLRLAIPPDEVPLRTETVFYGVRELPVTWTV